MRDIMPNLCCLESFFFLFLFFYLQLRHRCGLKCDARDENSHCCENKGFMYGELLRFPFSSHRFLAAHVSAVCVVCVYVVRQHYA